jgi:hypothetical protein
MRTDDANGRLGAFRISGPRGSSHSGRGEMRQLEAPGGRRVDGRGCVVDETRGILDQEQQCEADSAGLASAGDLERLVVDLQASTISTWSFHHYHRYRIA